MEKKEIRVVAGIIIKENKILAVKRGYGKWKGYWEFPGGKIEINETTQDALKRELKEELDIEISDLKFLTDIEYSYPDFNLAMECYTCSLLSHEITLKEHEEMRWLRPDELDSLQWLPADYQIFPLLKFHF